MPTRQFASTKDAETDYSCSVRSTADRPDARFVLQNLGAVLARKRNVRAVAPLPTDVAVLVSQYDAVLAVVRVSVTHCWVRYSHGN